MTISSEIRKAGPFSCNGVTVDFPFSFKVFSTADVRVVRTTPTLVESDMVLTTDYSVVLNADQDSAPGGTVTTVSALATGYLLTLTSKMPNTQGLDLTNQGGFYPKVINAAMDRLTIMIQQVAEAVGRAVKVDISSSTDPNALIDEINANTLAAAASASSASASASSASASASSASASASSAASSATLAQAAVGGVKITASDTTASPLNTALSVSGLVTKAVVSPGADETLKLSLESATGKLLGRATAGSGDVEALTVSGAVFATGKAIVQAPEKPTVGGSYYLTGTYNVFFNNVLSPNTLYFSPFTLPASAAIQSLQFKVQLAGTGVRLGIYSDVGGRPGALLGDYGTVSTSTGGVKVVNVSADYDAGEYWIGLASQGNPTILTEDGAQALAIANAMVRSRMGYSDSPVVGGSVNIAYTGFKQAHTYGALPSTPGTLTAESVVPAIAVKL